MALTLSPPRVEATVARRARPVLPLLFGMAAMLVCATFSWIPSLWGDEAASLMSATRPVGSLLRMLTHLDAVHGAYYLLLHGWVALFGTSPFALRLPSAIAIGVAVAGTVAVARRVAGTPTAVTAGVLACTLPRLTYAGEEARSYAASAAVAVWLTWLLIVLIEREGPRTRLLLAYGLLLALGIYLFLYLALLPLAHGVVLASSARGRARLARWLMTCGVVAVAVSPVAVFAVLERRQIVYLELWDPITPAGVFVSPWFSSQTFAVLGWTAILASALIVVLERRSGTAGALGRRRLLLIAVPWLAIPSAVLVGVSLLSPIYTARYLTFCAPAAVLAMAPVFVWVGTRLRPLSWAALALVVAMALPIWLAQRGPYAKNNNDWAQVSALIHAHAAPGEGVLFDESARLSRRPRFALRTYPAGFAGLEFVQLRTPYWDSLSWHDEVYPLADPVITDRLSRLSVVWLVDYGHPSGSKRYGMDRLTALGFTVDATWSAHASTVYRLERPQSGQRTAG